MNRYKLFKAGIHASEGVERVGGNAEAYESMLVRFPKDPYFSRLCEAITQKNVETAFEAAHALKGIVGNLSMNRMYDDLVPLVEQLRGGSMEGADELLYVIRQDYNAVIEAVEQMM